uniref:Ig-like domain-containing protein n=1 Tax=Cyprinus carpio TaxID=7962 RepID=A0A8C1TRS6_CYPCA
KYTSLTSYLCVGTTGRNYSEPKHKIPKPTVTIKPAQHVFRGETVTLRCDMYSEGVTSGHSSWYKDGSFSVFSDHQEHTLRSVTESDAGEYTCYGSKGSDWSEVSDAVTLRVSGEPPLRLFSKKVTSDKSSHFLGQTVFSL